MGRIQHTAYKSKVYVIITHRVYNFTTFSCKIVGKNLAELLFIIGTFLGFMGYNIGDERMENYVKCVKGGCQGLC